MRHARFPSPLSPAPSRAAWAALTLRGLALDSPSASGHVISTEADALVRDDSTLITRFAAALPRSLPMPSARPEQGQPPCGLGCTRSLLPYGGR